MGTRKVRYSLHSSLISSIKMINRFRTLYCRSCSSDFFSFAFACLLLLSPSPLPFPHTEDDPSSKPPHEALKHHIEDSKHGASKHVHLMLPAKASGYRRNTVDNPTTRFHRRNDLESSVMTSISCINPNMHVTESVLGKSVVPARKKFKKSGKRGHRVLCLDGGGVKVSFQASVSPSLAYQEVNV